MSLIKKIYPSSSAFMSGPLVKAKSHSSCLRYISAVELSEVLRKDMPNDIPGEYAALGLLNEARIAFKLEKEGYTFEREKPFKIDFKGVQISGRMDFVLSDGTILETKATTSEYVYKRVFEGGQPEISWVAQVASYLAFLKAPKAKIIASYYEVSEDFSAFQVVAEKEFIVECLDSGVIVLDGKEYPHSVKDLARWYSLAVQALNDPTTPMQEPHQPANKFESPCNFCPIKASCQSGIPLATLKERLKEELTRPSDAQKVFRIKHNTKRRQINREKKNDVRVSSS